MASAASVTLVAPVGVENTQPCTETTSFTANPARLFVVKFVKVVSEAVCTVIVTGAQEGGVPQVAAGGTKKTGIIASVKLSDPEVGRDATVPVI